MHRISMLLPAFLAFASPSLAAPDMIAVSFNGNVYGVYSNDGTGFLIGPSGAGGLNAMATDAFGQIFVADISGGLHRIDEITGAATFLGNLGGDVRGLAINGKNEMYAVFDGGGGGSLPDDLYRIDLGTFAATLVGNTGRTGLQALAFDPKGQLYAWDVALSSSVGGTGLNTLDTSTGVATDVDSSVGSNDSIQFLAFSPAGKLYGGTSSLLEIDPASGKTQLVGSGGYADLRGADFTGATCGDADWANYGSGTAGTNGVPKLVLTADPVLGTKPALVVASSATTDEISVLFFGLSPTAIAAPWGGPLLVKPILSLPVKMPPQGWAITLPIPLDAALCGLTIRFQVAQTDPGGAFGLAATPGLRATLGL